MDPFLAGAAAWLLQQAAGKVFDLAVNRLLKSMGFDSASPSPPNTQSLLEEYRRQLTARLDEDRIANLYGALSQLKDAQQTVAKQGYLIQALSAFHVIAHLPEQGMTGGKRNAELRCVALLGMAAAHLELGDQPQLTAEKIIKAVQADPSTAERWLGKQVVQTILTQFPLPQQPSLSQASTASASANIPSQHVPPSGVFVVAPQGGDYTGIQEAVQDVPSGSRILIRPGTYYAVDVKLDKALELVGDGPKADILWSGSFQMMSTKAVIQGLTLRGMATVLQGQLSLIDCDFSPGPFTTSEKEGGIYVFGSAAEAIIQRCTIHHVNFGVTVHGYGQLTIEESEIFANQFHGVLAVAGTIQILRCKIYDNGSTGITFGADVQGNIEECQFKRNRSGAWYSDGPNQVRLHKNTKW